VEPGPDSTVAALQCEACETIRNDFEVHRIVRTKDGIYHTFIQAKCHTAARNVSKTPAARLSRVRRRISTSAADLARYLVHASHAAP
jgi:hypothetical protein